MRYFAPLRQQSHSPSLVYTHSYLSIYNRQSTEGCSHLSTVQALLVPDPAAVYAAHLSWQHLSLLEGTQVPPTWFSASPTLMEPELATGLTAGHNRLTDNRL